MEPSIGCELGMERGDEYLARSDEDGNAIVFGSFEFVGADYDRATTDGRDHAIGKRLPEWTSHGHVYGNTECSRDVHG